MTSTPTQTEEVVVRARKVDQPTATPDLGLELRRMDTLDSFSEGRPRSIRSRYFTLFAMFERF